MILPDLRDSAFALNPDATAIRAPFDAPLSYDALPQQIAVTAGALRRAKDGKQDKAAIVMPNGPELAATLVVVASGAVCAPPNPNFSDRDAKAPLLPVNEAGPTRVVAKEPRVRGLYVRWQHRALSAPEVHLPGDEIMDALESATRPRSLGPRPECAPPTRAWR